MRAVTQIARLLDANHGYAAARAHVGDAKPSRRLAVLTCMDARIDVFAVLGLHLGEAHVLRNAGGRVTDDVLRSLALSAHVLGVDTLVVMQHTKCGLAGVTDDELREHTGADLGFFPIDDHAAALARGHHHPQRDPVPQPGAADRRLRLRRRVRRGRRRGPLGTEANQVDRDADGSGTHARTGHYGDDR